MKKLTTHYQLCWKSLSFNQYICTKKLTLSLIPVSRKTLRRYCQHLGFRGRTLTQEEVEELFLLNRWLGARHGVNSRKQFMCLRRQKLLRTELIKLGVDIDKDLFRLHQYIEHAYETQQLPIKAS
ncbi:MAG: hypothetical protein F6J89_01980 [Symploca sp. SIO1C4]|uniref:Uncharacterized protein n=1 Tax=Symploca sp. SIO1C4 TaxID=2607765 RepID=A0A6B3MZX9_9CYAN|nr:hypothetical protein [Symploca sp. SIO2E9]NER26409.1 hypothetical protein [Symploca sp. SIO1C4]NET07852.1 hypothetical protein [Symploca sp. SIO2B6]NET47646.1 hypothetical protein [Merismopedia sp. SIO2A8]